MPLGNNLFSKKKVRFIIIVLITILIFYLIFKRINYNSLREVLLNANLSYLALTLLVFLLSPIISAKKWRAMVKAINYPLEFKESLRIIMAAYPVAVITPARSGDLIRAYYLKDRIPPGQTAGAVLIERLIDILVLAIYSFFGALILKNGLILKISLPLIVSVPLFLFITSKIKLPSSKWQNRIENFLAVSKIFIKQPRKLLPILFYASILWTIPIIGAKLLFLSLGTDVPLLYVAAAFPVVIFIGLLPITIAGMGTRDSAMIYFFSPFVEPGISLGAGLLYSFFGYWFLALLGLPFMRKMLR